MRTTWFSAHFAILLTGVLLAGNAAQAGKDECKNLSSCLSACERNKDDHQCVLAARELYKRKDLDRATALLESSCNAGGADSCGQLAWAIFTGLAGPKDDSRMLDLADRACDGGGGSGCRFQTLCYRGFFGCVKDDKKAFGYELRGCNAGDSTSCENASQDYLGGRGVAKNEALAEQFALKACPDKSCVAYAKILVAQGNSKGALAIYDSLCKSGDTHACDEGRELRAASGDASTLVEHLRESCSRNSSLDCAQLGWLYVEGKTVPADGPKAVMFLRRGCDLADRNACMVLADVFSSGKLI